MTLSVDCPSTLPPVPRAGARGPARVALRHPGLRLSLVLAVLLCWPLQAVETYSSVEDALARAYPEAASVVAVEPALGPEQAKAVLEAARCRARGKLGGVYLAHSGPSLHGVAYVDHVIGRTEFITYLCALDATGAVSRMEVLVYREPYGSEVRGRSWLERFEGRRHGEELRLKREVPNIAGATMSCSGIVERTRFLLAFHTLVVAAQVPAWLPPADAAAPAGEPDTISRAVVVGEPVLSVQLRVAGDRAAALAAADAAVAAAEALDARVNAWRAESELRRLVAAGGGQPSPALASLIDRAAALHAASAGAFDPTIKPVLECWADAVAAGARPGTDALAAARARSGFSRVHWDGQSLRLPPGMDLDLSALHKGAVLDAAAALLRERNQVGSLDFGGSSWVAVGEPLAIRLRDPASPGQEWSRVELAAGQALAVSAAAGRGWRLEGTPVAHLIDARDGQPVAALRAAAVIAPDAVTADGLATVACLLELEQARALVAATPGAAALLRGPDGRVETAGPWPAVAATQDP